MWLGLFLPLFYRLKLNTVCWITRWGWTYKVRLDLSFFLFWNADPHCVHVFSPVRAEEKEFFHASEPAAPALSGWAVPAGSKKEMIPWCFHLERHFWPTANLFESNGLSALSDSTFAFITNTCQCLVYSTEVKCLILYPPTSITSETPT